jgi:hypothetical protein
MNENNVRALSLWQPWATAIALGGKVTETRGWSTSYRGPLLIHAARLGLPWRQLAELMLRPEFAWLRPAGIGGFPRGVLLAICELVDVVPTENYVIPSQRDNAMGNFGPGRFAWVLRNVERLKPYPLKGRQQLFRVSDEVLLAQEVLHG